MLDSSFKRSATIATLASEKHRWIHDLNREWPTLIQRRSEGFPQRFHSVSLNSGKVVHEFSGGKCRVIQCLSKLITKLTDRKVIAWSSTCQRCSTYFQESLSANGKPACFTVCILTGLEFSQVPCNSSPLRQDIRRQIRKPCKLET